ncbi:hypothetical protein ABFB09_01540 [Dehalogenimonas sp. THU2]|uniref:hypothetical protein n=1 Tax=Dehalogenimonas sp. THU2 TaxID=3151121 RepID=UPI003218230B
MPKLKFPGSPKLKRITYSVTAAVVIIVLTVGSSLYAKSVLNPNELTHFFVPFPAGRIIRPQVLPKPDGTTVFVRPVTVYVNERGILKRWLNGSIEGLSTHWLINLDDKPHRIGLKFTSDSVEIDWDVHAGIPWDPATQTFLEPVAPGEQVPELGVDWFFHFPKEIQAQDIWYQGSLEVFDADTGETLTTIPIKFEVRTADETNNSGH